MAVKLGVIGAMEVEVEQLRERLAGRATSTRAGLRFDEGVLGQTPVVVVKCGIGKVNAAMCAQALIDLYGVTHVVNTGVAGSLDPTVDVMDLVVSTDAVHHDYDLTIFGYAPGQVPGTPEAGFKADEGMRRLVRRAAAEVAPQIGVHDGRIASGDQFVSDQTEKDRITAQFGARCCEMEGASIAHVCTLNGVPFVVVRAISDKADGAGMEEEYPVFERKAAHLCAEVVERMARLAPEELR